MTDSILTDIKKVLNIAETDDSFDTDIILHTNSVLAVLQQVGAIPDPGFEITGANEKWTDLIVDDGVAKLVKSYLGAKVALLFDPPGTSYHLKAKQEVAAEFEWRLHINGDEFPTS